MNRIHVSAVVLVVGCFIFSQTSAEQKRNPETVLVTFQVRVGQEAHLQQVISEAWAAYVRRGMVRRDPHLLLKNIDEKGNTTMFEIFSWKDSSVPDNAGPEVRKLWNEMEGLCEKRAERRGIDFTQVEPITLNAR
jgi:hypothetical protein